MSLVLAAVSAPREAAAEGLADLRKVDGLDRRQLSVEQDGRERVASATTGWAARLALRVAKLDTGR